MKMLSTGCPRCNVLKKKLDAKGIDYELITDIDEITEYGVVAVPVLITDEGNQLNFKEAVDWLNNME